MLLLYLGLGLLLAMVLAVVWRESKPRHRAGNYLRGSPHHRIQITVTSKPSGTTDSPRRPPAKSRQPAAATRRHSALPDPVTRGLIIRAEPLGKILRGEKTWEMRSRPIAIRETIALIQKGSKTVVGVADLVDCRGPLSDSERFDSEHLHAIDPERWDDPSIANYRYAWVLENVRPLEKPVPYIHRGGVQFATLDQAAVDAIELATAPE